MAGKKKAPDAVNPVIEAAKAHYAEQGFDTLEVPEWPVDGQPTVIYYPPFTVGEAAEINRATRRAPDTYMARVVVVRARNADGSKMFTVADVQPLIRETDAGVLNRIAELLTATDSLEDTSGN
jgi:hypothetical protein